MKVSLRTEEDFLVDDAASRPEKGYEGGYDDVRVARKQSKRDKYSARHSQVARGRAIDAAQPPHTVIVLRRCFGGRAEVSPPSLRSAFEWRAQRRKDEERGERD